MPAALPAMHLTDAYADAIETGDLDRLAGLFAPGCEIWHNSDGLTIDLEHAIASLRALVVLSTRREFADRRVRLLAEGFVFQFVLIAEAQDGERVELSGCMICAITDGMIARIEEYVDPAPIRRWFAHASAAQRGTS